MSATSSPTRFLAVRQSGETRIHSEGFAQRTAYPRTIALVGIDGAGKSTVAEIFATDLQATGIPSQIMRNPSGRRWLSRLPLHFGSLLSPALANRFEWAVRCTNVLYGHVRATRFPGITVMDRHIPCQLVLQAMRGFPSGRMLPWVLAKLPRPEVIVLIDVPADIAYQRILTRGEDYETLVYLEATRSAYLELAKNRGWYIVDGTGSARQVADAVARAALGLDSSRPLK